MIKTFLLKLGLALLLLVVLGSVHGCKKDSGVNQGEIDRGLIEAYILENDITGEFTSTGLFYKIIEPGDEVHPGLYSTVTVTYKGVTLSGQTVDEGSFITFKLNELIIGWQEGLQLIGEGGKIKLIIPSEMAYGKEVLVFDITLHYFSNS